MAKLASYNPAEIERRLVEKWQENEMFQPDDNSGKTKSYVLGMFPYPSGEGLHTGHGRIFTAVDVIGRYLRMKGDEVLMPIGWDAFGLPAENAAIKAKTNPMKMVPKNEANFKRQMQMLGLSYDWGRAFSTTDPEYYRWTQWIFLKLYGIKNKKGERLVYRKEVPINWCPKCKTGLANEEVLSDGTHERCGTMVTQRMLPQWVMRITDYSDRLLYDLDHFEWERDGQKVKGLDWPKGILEMQRNWIGRKEGIKVTFELSGIAGQEDGKHKVEVFTTRLDTIFGVTFLVISPELAKKWLEVGWKASKEVSLYVESALAKTEQQRLEENREKTGVVAGIMAVNPVNGEKVPVFVADYVLGEVGTGAVMGVPAHDERDGEFAKKFEIPFKEVIDDKGELVNSGKYDGLNSLEAIKALVGDLGEKVKKEVTYHLRDWVFSRQRYWGEPFPLVYCDKCGDENGVVPLSEDQLPLKLPELESYEPTDSGESPLSRATSWLETVCPKCGGKARRETDTMPNWAGSCWYFLRFADPKNDKEAWSKETLAKWLPVDWYLGGAEHAVLHLLYARFWVKALYDLKLLDFTEPFLRLRGVGMVLAEDGRKMSKSLGNIVNPDEMVSKFGADTLRIYEMFMGPWDQAIAWETRSLVGCRRFLEKVWGLVNGEHHVESDKKLVSELNKLIKKVGEDISETKFNTAVASMMKFVNAVQKASREKVGLAADDWKRFLLILAPFAPFMAEELWQIVGKKSDFGSIHLERWPEGGEVVADEKVMMVVQVNGRLRATIEAENDKSKNKSEMEKLALEDIRIKKWVNGEYDLVFVQGRLLNFVLK